MAKGGSGPISGLWLGTAVFSALKAKDFGGFVKSYVWYALLIALGLVVLVWLMKQFGVERFTDIQCQPGETPTSDCYGERGCTRPSGNCYKLLSASVA